MATATVTAIDFLPSVSQLRNVTWKSGVENNATLTKRLKEALNVEKLNGVTLTDAQKASEVTLKKVSIINRSAYGGERVLQKFENKRPIEGEKDQKDFDDALTNVARAYGSVEMFQNGRLPLQEVSCSFEIAFPVGQTTHNLKFVYVPSEAEFEELSKYCNAKDDKDKPIDLSDGVKIVGETKIVKAARSENRPAIDDYAKFEIASF